MALHTLFANKVNHSLNQKRRLSLISQKNIERNDLFDTFNEILTACPKKRLKNLINEEITIEKN